jgi:hypothetical protein
MVAGNDCLLGCCTVMSSTSLPTFQRCLLPPSSEQWAITLMMEAESTSETSANFYQTTRCNIPDNRLLLNVSHVWPIKPKCQISEKNILTRPYYCWCTRKKNKKNTEIIHSKCQSFGSSKHNTKWKLLLELFCTTKFSILNYYEHICSVGRDGNVTIMMHSSTHLLTPQYLYSAFTDKVECNCHFLAETAWLTIKCYKFPQYESSTAP